MRPNPRQTFVATCALAAVAVGGCSRPADPPTAHTPSQARTAAPTTSSAGVAPATVVRSWNIGGFLDGIAYTRGVLWVSDLKADRVVRLNTSTGRQLPDIPVQDGPLTVVANTDAVWVASYLGSTVARLDSRTGAKAATITTPSPQPCAIAVTGDGVWIFDQSDGAGGFAPLQGATLRPVQQQAHAGFASVGFGAVWVPNFTGGPGAVTRLDLTTHATRATRVGHAPIQALAAGDSVWVSNTTDSTVTRLDPTTLATRATIAVPGGQTGGLAYADGLVWVTSYEGNLVAAIDPATNTVVGTVTVPGSAENIAVDARGNLWVTQSTGTITELKPTARAHP